MVRVRGNSDVKKINIKKIKKLNLLKKLKVVSIKDF